MRPILLTTLTTVLGLLPLLFEASKDAQFLKPTVITLVYGLGFGMFVILFLVPALVVIQRDFKRLYDAFKRLIFSKRLSLFGMTSIWLGLFSIIVVFFVGFGSSLFSGKSYLLGVSTFINYSPLLINFLSVILVTAILILWLIVFRRKLFSRSNNLL